MRVVQRGHDGKASASQGPELSAVEQMRVQEIEPFVLGIRRQRSHPLGAALRPIVQTHRSVGLRVRLSLRAVQDQEAGRDAVLREALVDGERHALGAAAMERGHDLSDSQLRRVVHVERMDAEYTQFALAAHRRDHRA